MSISLQISRAEISLIPAIEQFFLSVYPEEKMVSHGISHHRRVWRYASEILAEAIIPDDQHFVSKLLISCYLHDIGMVIDPGPQHGGLSSALCQKFLKDHNSGINDPTDILSAIENHDDKSYSMPGKGNELLKILSVADDLDAFGYAGIFRYSEIYLLRKVSLTELGSKVLENAAGRYSNFIAEFGSSDKLVRRHSERYSQLVTFFKEYNNCCGSYNFRTSEHYGICGIAGVFSEIVSDIISLSQAMEKYAFSTDGQISDYFNNLKAELG